MNVAAGSEVDGAGQANGNAAGVASRSLRVPAPGQESFQTGLQSLLATLGSGPVVGSSAQGREDSSLAGLSAECLVLPAANSSSAPATNGAFAVRLPNPGAGNPIASSADASTPPALASQSLISLQARMLETARHTQANPSSIGSSATRNATDGPEASRSTKTSKSPDADSAADLPGASISTVAAIAHLEPSISNSVEALQPAFFSAKAFDPGKSEGKTDLAVSSVLSSLHGSSLESMIDSPIAGPGSSAASLSARGSSAKSVQANSGKTAQVPNVEASAQRQGPAPTASARAESIVGEEGYSSGTPSTETTSRALSLNDSVSGANYAHSASSDAQRSSNNQDADLGDPSLLQAASAFSGTGAAGEAGKTPSSGGARARTGPGSTASEPVQEVGRVTVVQSAALPTDAALVRDLSGALGTACSAREPAGTPGVPTASAGDTFAALDARSGPGTVSWTHAGARSAEAGYEDPTFGWVGVRADLSGGAVHAAVLPSSIEAAQALGSHMSGLNSYLAGHHTPVETVTLAGPHGSETGMGTPTNQGGAQNAGQDGSSGQDTGSQASSSAAVRPEMQPATAGDRSIEQVLPALPGGAHISVMA